MFILAYINFCRPKTSRKNWNGTVQVSYGIQAFFEVDDGFIYFMFV